jgi:hypothetical protein
MKVKIEDFINEAFEYRTKLEQVATNTESDPHLVEYVANGFVKYGSPEEFVKNIQSWMRTMTKLYREINFNSDTNQIHVVIDLTDNYVMISKEVMEELKYVIDIQKKYGLLIKYWSVKRNIEKQTTLSYFFEHMESLYPGVKDRYKGLGSAPEKVSAEIIMNPATRRLIQVTANDVDTELKLAQLVGGSDDNIQARKEMLMDFKFDMSMIDN